MPGPDSNSKSTNNQTTTRQTRSTVNPQFLTEQDLPRVRKVKTKPSNSTSVTETSTNFSQIRTSITSHITPTMATAQEIQAILKTINEQSQQAATRQAEAIAKTNQDFLEKQTEYMKAMCTQQNDSTRQIVESMLSQDKRSKKEQEEHRGQKILDGDIQKPTPFSMPTKFVSIDTFIKRFKTYIDETNVQDPKAYAKNIRNHLTGDALDWYHGNVSGDMAQDFDAIIAGLRDRFACESHAASSLRPMQGDKSVAGFYSEFMKIATAQNWQTEYSLQMFSFGLSDDLRTSVEVRHPKTVTEAYKLAKGFEADKAGSKQTMEDIAKTLQNLALQKNHPDPKKPKDDISEEEIADVRAFRRVQRFGYSGPHQQDQDFQRLDQKVSEMAKMMEKHLSDRNVQPLQNNAPYNYQTQHSQSSYRPPPNQWSSDQHQKNYSNPNPRYLGWNYNPNFVPRYKQQGHKTNGQQPEN